MFVIVMVVGLAGLAVMAFPALFSHGPAGHLPPHGALGNHGPTTHVGGHGLVGAPAAAQHGSDLRAPGTGPGSKELIPGAAGNFPRSLIPSPRGVFTALALFGAFGNAAVDLFHTSALMASLLAVLPTIIVERVLVRPLWNLVFRYQGAPESPFEALILSEAVAVTPFPNGRGIVTATRDGRAVQLSAQLLEAESREPVRVGDRLRIEQVDGARRRVTVSRILAS